ncbi:MAG: acyltransferase [Gemmataceae bacterium]
MTADVSEQFVVGLVQMRCDEQTDTNLTRAAELIQQAVQQGAHVVCLPELFRTPYFCKEEDTRWFDLAEPIPGPTTDFLTRLARQERVVLVASVFERRLAGVYHNSAIVVDADGRLCGLYRKMHIPDDPLYYEKFYFTPGDTGYRVFATRYARVAVLICWDQWFPEAARIAALNGAELVCYPSAIGWHPREKAVHGADQYQAWQVVQRGHAVANGVYVAAVNRVGYEGPAPGLEFWGGSFVADPFGRLLAQAAHDREEVLTVACSRRLLEETRRHWPFLRDRRIDSYHPLLKRVLDDADV